MALCAVDDTLLAVAQVFDAEHGMQQTANGVAAYRKRTFVQEFGVVGGHDDHTLCLGSATRYRTQPTFTVGARPQPDTTVQTGSQGAVLQLDGYPADSFPIAFILR